MRSEGICAKRKMNRQSKKQFNSLTTARLVHLCVQILVTVKYQFHFLYVCVGVAYSEEVLELWAIVECRYTGGKQEHGFCCIPPLLNHGLIKPS